MRRLHEAVAAVAPIVGVSVGTPGVPASVVVEFAPGATPPQRTAAAAVVTGFDWSQAAQAAWEEARVPERKGLRDDASAAVQANADYLALASPTNAQVAAQVRRLTQQNQRIIRRLIHLD